jgi:hypothetical protein
LVSASSVTGSSPPSAACATSRAKAPASVSGRRSHQSGRDPPRQRAIRRHQRGGIVLVNRLAQRHRDRECLVLGIRRLDDRDARECRGARGCIAVCRPVLGRLGRA